MEIHNEPVPLMTDVDGAVRIGGTRVTLDSVVAAFELGATAEEITQRYPSLDLADVYAVIGYYLHHRGDVETYLERRRQIAEDVRQENEAHFSMAGTRARLLARKAARESA